MRKYIDKDTNKTVIVSHYSVGNTNKIHLVLAPAVSPSTPAVSPDYGVDLKDYKVSLQDFLSNRFQEEFEIEN